MGLKERKSNILAYTVEVGKVILWNGRLKKFKFGNAKVYRMYVAAMALAKRRAKFTILAVFTIKLNQINTLGVFCYVTRITARNHVERQYVDG